MPRAILSQRRTVLDDVETIAAYAQDMKQFLKESEMTERRAFIETFVKEIGTKRGGVPNPGRHRRRTPASTGTPKRDPASAPDRPRRLCAGERTQSGRFPGSADGIR